MSRTGSDAGNSFRVKNTTEPHLKQFCGGPVYGGPVRGTKARQHRGGGGLAGGCTQHMLLPSGTPA